MTLKIVFTRLIFIHYFLNFDFLDNNGLNKSQKQTLFNLFGFIINIYIFHFLQIVLLTLSVGGSENYMQYEGRGADLNAACIGFSRPHIWGKLISYLIMYTISMERDFKKELDIKKGLEIMFIQKDMWALKITHFLCTLQI